MLHIFSQDPSDKGSPVRGQSSSTTRRFGLRAAALGLSIVVVGVLSACSSGGTSATSTAAAVTSARIVLPSVVSGDQLDPTISTGYMLNFTENVFDTLYKFDSSGKPVPNVATADSVSADQLTHTLTLRSDVMFQDGTKMTSADVAYSLERQQGLLPGEAKPIGTGGYTHIASVQTPSPTQVVIHLTQPDPDLHNELAFTSGMIVPKAYVTKVGNQGFWNHPIGSGPYEFVSETPGQSITIKAFPKYWGAKPAVKNVTFTFNTNTSARVDEVEAGTADLAFAADPSQVATIKSKGMTTVPLQLGNVQYIAFSGTTGGLTNPQVGQALNLAIDRASIVKNILHGFGTLAASLDTSPATIDKSMKPYPYDPTKAKKMLQAANFDFSQPLSLAVPIGRWTASDSIVAAIVSDLQKVGVTVNVQNMDLGTWANKNGSNTLGTALNLTGLPNSYFDPIPNWANVQCGKPYSLTYCDKTLDAKIAAASALSGSARVSATQGVDAYMHSNPPGVFLFQTVEIEVLSPKFTWDPLQGAAYIKLEQLQPSGK